MSLSESMLKYARSVDDMLASWIDELDVAEKLQVAIRYSVFNGGKRIRPALVLATADAISKSNALSMAAAASVECLHAYSLVHDDLPAMDDDDLRRGKPTCHIQFDEATAVLVGDALQALAFEKIAQYGRLSPRLPDMIVTLAQSVGANGMVGGQSLDLEAENKTADTVSLEQLQRIHRFKTGALISAAVKLGALSINASDAEIASMGRYAAALGLAFQVQDDIIDVTSDTQSMGKTQGSDQVNGKSTFVSLLGLEASRLKADELVITAKNALAEIGSDNPFLSDLADFCISRNN